MRGLASPVTRDTAAYSEALTVADMAALLDAVGASRRSSGALAWRYMSLAFYRAIQAASARS